MEGSFGSRLKHAWNAFSGKENYINYNDVGPGYYTRPDRTRLTGGNEKSIVTAVYNRISLDCAAIDIKHARLDSNKRYISDMNTSLNECLTLQANLDETSRAFVQNIVLSMFDEGVIAVVPTVTSINPGDTSGGYDIHELRVGKILEWYPQHVKVELYNPDIGQKTNLTFPKKAISIIENPFYAVMNEPNSTLKRLIHKLNLLDSIDEQSGSGKLDLIVQLPYVIKTEARRAQAEQRRKDIEVQLSGSKYGIAYTDGSEHITQLNRPVENNLMKQIEYLTSMLYSQLGMTQAVMDGTADEKEMINYHNRTIEPILSAITIEFKRKFLSKTARSQNQSIIFIRDPFKLVPVMQLATISDTLTRNEIASSNEIRGVIGWAPSTDPKADELRNKNLNASKNANDKSTLNNTNNNEGGSSQNGEV